MAKSKTLPIGARVRHLKTHEIGTVVESDKYMSDDETAVQYDDDPTVTWHTPTAKLEEDHEDAENLKAEAEDKAARRKPK
jgi:hypothetical protein